MKHHYLFVAVVAALAFSSCTKSNNVTKTPAVKTADFSTKLNIAYLSQTVEFNAADTAGKTNYSWNYGDGTTETVGHTGKHVYKTAGVYTVTLNINGLSKAVKIKVYPGNISYQIKNESKQTISLSSYIDMDNNGSLAKLSFAPGAVSDTLYATTAITGSLLHIAGLSGTANNKAFVVYDTFWLKGTQHNVISLTGTTNVVINKSRDIVTLGAL